VQGGRLAVDLHQPVQVQGGRAQRLGGDVLELQCPHGFGNRAVDRLAAAGDLPHAVVQATVHAFHALDHRRGLGAGTARAVQVARSHGGHGVADLGDRVLGAVRQLADLLVEGGRALRQVAHLVGHDREATARLAGTRCLDGGVECQQVGLVGDRLHVLQQREDTVQVLGHRVDVADGGPALAGDFLQRLHQLLHLAAGLHGELVDVHAALGAAAVEDPGDDLALAPGLPVHGVEAAAEAGDRLADQLAGAVDLGARAVDLGADEAAQFVEQLALLAHQRGLGTGAVHVPGQDEPCRGHRDGGPQPGGIRPVEHLGDQHQEGERHGRCEADDYTGIHHCSRRGRCT